MKSRKYVIKYLSIIGLLILSSCEPEDRSSVETVDATSSLSHQSIQTIGVNVNGQFDLMKDENLERSETTWVRGFIDIFQLYPEVSKLNTDPRMKEYLKLKDKGYQTILNIKWNFTGKSFPATGSQEIKDYKKYLRKFLGKVWKQTDIIVIGNEPFIESKPEERDQRLVEFYKEIANEVNNFKKGQGDGVGNGKGIKEVPIYLGAFNNLYLNEWRTQAVEDLLAFAEEKNWISGIDLHIHHSAINQVNQAMDYVNDKIRNNQKILITEYSLMKHWRFKMGENIPENFAENYERDVNEKNFQYIDYALKNQVSHQEWVDFLSESYWFENRTRYLWNSYQRMRSYDKFHIGTYALRQSFPFNRDFTNATDPWILNGLFANRTVTLNNEGLEQFNYAWIDDFKAIQNQL